MTDDRQTKNAASEGTSEMEIPSGALLGFRLPPDAAKKFNKLTANDWTKEDWADLLKAQNWVIASVAARHGISEPNAEAHGRRSRTVQPLVGHSDSGAE